MFCGTDRNGSDICVKGIINVSSIGAIKISLFDISCSIDYETTWVLVIAASSTTIT
jgi:hypothetical protein